MINARVSATLCKTTMSSKRYGRLLVGNLDGDYYLSDSIAMWRVPQKAIDRNIFTDLEAINKGR